LWKSNLNDITGDHASENYEVNMWGKYCRLYPEFALKTPQQQCFIKGTTNIRTLTDSPTQKEKQVL
jgi:hypothetical protein